MPTLATRRAALIGAVSLTAALILTGGIAVGVALPDAAESPTPAPTVTLEADPAQMEAQIMETCAWEQATFYAPVRSREDAYAAGVQNCTRSAADYGMAQLIEKYGTKEK